MLNQTTWQISAGMNDDFESLTFFSTGIYLDQNL